METTHNLQSPFPNILCPALSPIEPGNSFFSQVLNRIILLLMQPVGDDTRQLKLCGLQQVDPIFGFVLKAGL